MYVEDCFNVKIGGGVGLATGSKQPLHGCAMYTMYTNSIQLKYCCIIIPINVKLISIQDLITNSSIMIKYVSIIGKLPRIW